MRAIWVVCTSLTSPDAIRRMVDNVRSSGFNTLLVQVRSRGDAYYNSTREPRARALSSQSPSFDPLRLVVSEAHRAGLRVHAWMNAELVANTGELPKARSHVIYQHPEWLMVPRRMAAQSRALDPHSPTFIEKLRAAVRQGGDAEGLYLSPVSADAVDYLASVVGDVASHYEVDGIHLDYIRYPGEDYDYSRAALSLFRDAISKDIPSEQLRKLRARERNEPTVFADTYPAEWRQFRMSRLTSLIEKLHKTVKAANRDTLVTAAVIADPRDAREGKLQDWPQWIRRDLLDVACPMAYAQDAVSFAVQVAAAQEGAGAKALWVGIGAYRLTPDQTIESVRAVRRVGANGVVLFSYDNPAASADRNSLSRIGHAVFEH